jgi:hypothetical protein
MKDRNAESLSLEELHYFMIHPLTALAGLSGVNLPTSTLPAYRLAWESATVIVNSGRDAAMGSRTQQEQMKPRKLKTMRNVTTVVSVVAVRAARTVATVQKENVFITT